MANERRLIDADAATERLRLESVMRYPQSWGMGLLAAMETLRGFPTVDAVEVCYCKDCKHSVAPKCQKAYCEEKGILKCYKPCGIAFNRRVYSSDFCSYGEKREVE